MTLADGTRLGPYAVSGKIGAGGMGEVFRARDTKLKRDVALKVLPASFAEDEDRLARFQREAEILAALNHPNIATIYGLEQDDDQTVIVMELVEGPTLADRIAEGPLPPDEAMTIAMQVIAALEAAHDKGIVHRDLKPANVKVREDGTVKVLDFGISKPIDASAISGGSPVMTTPAMTQTGVILGTAAYMSPEQARGKFVDERTDIWAFGCLLFEMLTGQPAFGGEDVMLTLARVLDRDTDLSSIPSTISPAVRQTLKLCLEKDPKRRIADIRDVRLALDGTFESELPRGDDDVAARSPIGRRITLAGTSMLLGIILVAVVAAVIWPEPQPRPVRAFEYRIPAEHQFRSVLIGSITVSSDGNRYAYLTSDGIRVRDLRDTDLLEPRLIEGIDSDIAAIQFFPGGNRLAFASVGDVIRGDWQRVSLDGSGVPVAMPNEISVSLSLGQFSWADGDSRIVGHAGGISQVLADGSVKPLIDLNDDSIARYAQQLPDGVTLLYVGNDGPTNFGAGPVFVQRSGSDESIPLGIEGRRPQYLDSGHLVWQQDNFVYAQAFDLETLELFGQQEIVITNVALALGTGDAQFDVADDGTLVYVTPGVSEPNGGVPPLAWVDFDDGSVTPLPFAEAQEFFFPRLSPDRTKLAVARRVDENWDIFVYDLERGGTPQRITTHAGMDIRPIWFPDGRRLLFYRSGDQVDRGIYVVDQSGGTEPEKIWSVPAGIADVWPVSIDGERNELWFSTWNGVSTPGSNNGGMYRLALADGADPVPLLDSPEAREQWPVRSPDGRWLAYDLDNEIYISPFADGVVGAGREKVSVSGGSHPFWDPDGGYLYYQNGESRLVRVSVETEPGFSFGPEQVLTPPITSLDSRVAGLAGGQQRPLHDIDVQGQRVLMRVFGEETDFSQGASIVVVENWFEVLEEIVPTDR